MYKSQIQNPPSNSIAHMSTHHVLYVFESKECEKEIIAISLQILAICSVATAQSTGIIGRAHGDAGPCDSDVQFMIPSLMHQAEWVFVLALHFQDMSSIITDHRWPNKDKHNFRISLAFKKVTRALHSPVRHHSTVSCAMRVLSEQLRKHEYKRQALRIR